MTKKDYELIAGEIKWVIEIKTIDGKESTPLVTLAKRLCNRLEAENPLFDRTKFLKACGLETKCYEEHERGQYKGLSVPHYHD